MEQTGTEVTIWPRVQRLFSFIQLGANVIPRVLGLVDSQTLIQQNKHEKLPTSLMTSRLLIRGFMYRRHWRVSVSLWFSLTLLLNIALD